MPFTSETARAAGRKSTRKTFASKVRAFLEENIIQHEGEVPKKRIDALLECCFQNAILGDAQFGKLLLGYAYGKPMETPIDERPHRIEVKFIDDNNDEQTPASETSIPE